MDTQPHSVEVLTVPAVKRRLRMDRPVDRALASGELPYVSAGGWRRVLWSDALAWLARNRRGGAQEVRP